MRFICSAVTIKSLLSEFFFLNNNSNNNNLERKDSYLDFSLLSLLLLLFPLFLFLFYPRSMIRLRVYRDVLIIIFILFFFSSLYLPISQFIYENLLFSNENSSLLSRFRNCVVYSVGPKRIFERPCCNVNKSKGL